MTDNSRSVTSNQEGSWTDPEPLGFARDLANAALATGSEHVHIRADFLLAILDKLQGSAVETTKHPPHWTCRTHGDFDAMRAVGCPECMREARQALIQIQRELWGSNWEAAKAAHKIACNALDGALTTAFAKSPSDCGHEHAAVKCPDCGIDFIGALMVPARHTLDCDMVKHPNCTRCNCGSSIDPNSSWHARQSPPASVPAIGAPTGSAAPGSAVETSVPADCEINAQHGETGRMWFGKRSALPSGFLEVSCQTHKFSAPCPKCAESALNGKGD